MKRRYLFALSFVLSLGVSYSQNEMDAYRFSQNELAGTARSVSMGGAFGALGGDVSAISINPAGLGVYKSGEIVTTLNFQNTGVESKTAKRKIDDSRFRFDCNNLSYVSVFHTGNEDVPFFNFGISYNKLKAFSREYTMNQNGSNNSMAQFMGHRTYGIKNPVNSIYYTGNSDAPLKNNDWMSVFGFSSYLITEDPAKSGTYLPQSTFVNNPLNKKMNMSERGTISSYDFTMGTTISDLVSLGLGMSITDFENRLETTYDEEIVGKGDYVNLKSFEETTGSGFQMSLGFILKPINEFRIGVSYHSPTWYNLTRYYSAIIDYDLTRTIAQNGLPSYGDNKFVKGDIKSGDFENDYKLNTPDYWTFSLAGIIANRAILSADVELKDYSKMKMKGADNRGFRDNEFIKKDFKLAASLRVGAEYRITPQFSARVGYAFTQNPLEKGFKNGTLEPQTYDAMSFYTADGDIHNITYGLGYKFKSNFYMDVAFVMSQQKSNFYPFYQGQDAGFKSPDFNNLTISKYQGLLTLGYRFFDRR